MAKYVQQQGQPPGLMGDANQPLQSPEALAQKARELAERMEARKQMLASKGALKSGYDYAETLRVIMTDPQAKAAYALADVVGVGSDIVEKRGYHDFINHVLDNSVNPGATNWVNKKDEVRALFDKRNPEAEMLKFARAMSAIATEHLSATGITESFSQSNQIPIMYVMTGQHSKDFTSRHELIAHAIKCAGSEREFMNLDLDVLDASNRYLDLRPRLLERAREKGVKLQ